MEYTDEHGQNTQVLSPPFKNTTYYYQVLVFNYISLCKTCKNFKIT